MNISSLSSYFERIGYTGSISPTIETLRGIHKHHVQSIPFENLNPLLKIPVALDLESIRRKLVDSRRGGWCFEHNHLLKYVLETIGFNVKGMGARVLWSLPEGIVTARGHMLLLVDVEGMPYIADAGFGGVTLTAPLKLETDVVQQTPHESFRIVKPQDDYVLQVQIKEEWKPVYRFNLQEHYLPDYEVANWYLCTNPASHFTKSLIVTMPSDGVRHVLRNNQFTRHYVDGRTEKDDIATYDDLMRLLRDTFKIDVPETQDTLPVLNTFVGMAHT